MSDHTADLIVINANIHTVNPNAPHAQSFAVKNGKFVAVGTNSDTQMLSSANTKILDLKGYTVVPGFIDAHIHVLSSGSRHVMAADCDLRSISDVQEALKRRSIKTKPGQWVQGFKYDDTKTEENRFLTTSDLDKVSTELPIFVSHRAGHVYYVNSKALALAGYTDNSTDPHGGSVELSV